MSKATYRIEIYTTTAKGKRNHIDDMFVSSDADERELAEHFTEKYRPLSVGVNKVKVVDIESEKQKEATGIVKTGYSNYESSPEYRIDRVSLPVEIIELLDSLEVSEKAVSDNKKAINKLLEPYFSHDGYMSSYCEDSITCHGYIRPLTLSLTKEKVK